MSTIAERVWQANGTGYLLPERFGGLHGCWSLADMKKIMTAKAEHVLILGETGSGKEGIAQIIGNQDPLDGRSYTAVNCAAFSEKLLASELFGHVKGSYTGATDTRPGILQQNAGGVVFLDEINKAPPELQGMLLRYMQTGDIKPVGADKPIQSQKPVRIIAAANETSASSALLLDFRHRFTYEVHIPALRDRPGDVPWLLGQRGFLGAGRTYTAITLRTLLGLMFHAWPGNIRELMTYCQRKLIIAQSVVPRYPEHVLDDPELITDDGYGEWVEFARHALGAIERTATWDTSGQAVDQRLHLLLLALSHRYAPKAGPGSQVPLPIIPISKLLTIDDNDSSTSKISLFGLEHMVCAREHGFGDWYDAFQVNNRGRITDALCLLKVLFDYFRGLPSQRKQLVMTWVERADPSNNGQKAGSWEHVFVSSASGKCLARLTDQAVASSLFSDPGPPERDFSSVLANLMLPEKDRIICEQCYTKKSIRDIAKVIGKPPSTIQERLADLRIKYPELVPYLPKQKPGRHRNAPPQTTP